MKKLIIFSVLAIASLPITAYAGDFSLTANKIKEIAAKDFVLKIENSQENLKGTELANWFFPETGITINKNYQSESENGKTLCSQKKLIACQLTTISNKYYHAQNSVIFKLDSDKLSSYMTDLARKFEREPTDAKLEIEEGKVTLFSPSKSGLKIDTDESVNAIIQVVASDNLSDSIALSYEQIEPEISEASINNIGIEKMIGEGVSDFRGSTSSRIHNIKAAVSRFDGLLIKPGEEFSFVQNLGEVDGEHGYLPELVIKNNKTEPEFGGGICQVSTTMFRAALNTGLEITARRNHAYPVQYYAPQGTDATIYIPNPDLRFVNNTPGHILIQSKIEGTKLYFQLYGTDDGRSVELKGPTITERKPDGGLKTVLYQTVTNKNGKVILDDIFRSDYESASKYPHPGETLTTKPDNWSKNEWKEYKKANGL